MKNNNHIKNVFTWFGLKPTSTGKKKERDFTMNETEITMNSVATRNPK